MLVQALWIAVAYVLGSVSWGLVIAKTFCGIDPRTDGSRSTGATNVSRLCGFGWGVATLLCDVLKGALPVWAALAINPSPVFVSLTGLACVLGHVFSCFMKFKGEAPSIEQIKADWANYAGRAQELNLPSAPKQFLHYFEEENRPQTRLDRDLEHGMAISIGRLRPDTQYNYKFVCLSHNTLRGAAGGAVLLAELLCAEGYITRK